MSEIDWKSPTLNLGQSMILDDGETFMTIDHINRKIDPYLAGVVHKNIIVYSGLHKTLGDARATCERRKGYASR